jgi:anthranilate phosphoribosyltransferase
MIREAIHQVAVGGSLTRGEAAQVMGEIMDGGATAAQIAALITALSMKGETTDEIAGFATAMRARAEAIRPRVPFLVDTCGTGGDGAGTFNISTVAAFVVAGAGAHVAKHGNRAVSSRCGSADLLETLQIPVDVNPGRVAEAIERTGIGFLFAPRFHPAMKHAVRPRREIGLRTVFNVLGPLTNPAGARRQVIGVFAPALVGRIAEVLRALGTDHAFVVHGGALDELSISGPSLVAEVRGDEIRTFCLSPEDAGLPRYPPDAVRGGEAAHNAAIASRVLRGERGPYRDVVLLNAAAALMAAGLACDFREGVAVAVEAIDSGAAYAKLEALRAFLTSPVTA